MKSVSPLLARRRSGLVVAVLAAVWLGSVGGCPTAGTQAGRGVGEEEEQGVTEVRIQNFSYAPREVTIKKGDKVRWENFDSVPHTVTSGDPGSAGAGQRFDSGLLSRGRSFERTFDTVGEFVYFCTPHADMPSMRGAKIIVQE